MESQSLFGPTFKPGISPGFASDALNIFGVRQGPAFLPIFDLLDQAGGANPSEIVKAISGLKVLSTQYRNLNAKLSAAGAPIGPAFENFNYGGQIDPQVNFSYQGNQVDNLILRLETLLSVIQAQQNADLQQQQLAAARATTDAVGSLARSFSSGRFIQGIATGVTRNIRTSSGNPSLTIGG